MKKHRKLLLTTLAFAIIFMITLIPGSRAKADATSVSLGLADEWTDGEITVENGIDFYSVTIPSDGWLTVSYQGWSITESYIEIWDRDMARTQEYAKDTYISSSDISPTTKAFTLPLEAGTYTVKIGALYGHSGNYKVKATFKPANNNEKTDNNDFAKAEQLSFNSSVNGFLSYDDTVDFFKINLTAKKRIRLIYTSYISDSYVTIYNKDFYKISEREVYTASEENPVVYEYQETLDPGVYYIKISPFNNSRYGRYNILYKEKITIKSMTVRASKPEITYGQKTKLSIAFSPSNADEKKVRWTSNNTGVADIDENTGAVSIWMPGVVKFTATALDGSGVSATCTLVVKPKKMSAPVLSNSRKKTLTISYNGQQGAKGYQYQYATNKKFKNAKGKRTTKTYINIKKLKKGKKYYVRVRSYVKNGSKYYYSKWSSIKSLKIKY